MQRCLSRWQSGTPQHGSSCHDQNGETDLQAASAENIAACRNHCRERKIKTHHEHEKMMPSSAKNVISSLAAMSCKPCGPITKTCL
jgi:hypothetical protein